jgi:flagellar biosynthesis/type III secretory pathway M-ring protein FliF/YscJ
MMQIAAPPPPPDLPLFLPGQAGELIEVALLGLVALIVLWPVMVALARRIERRGGEDPALRGEVEELRHRLADVEASQGRIADLEERLDFAERLLTQQREGARLPGSQE